MCEVLSPKEIEYKRINQEVDALRIASRLRGDSAEVRAAHGTASPAARDSQGYAATPAPRATTPAATPTAWTSAKQFP